MKKRLIYPAVIIWVCVFAAMPANANWSKQTIDGNYDGAFIAYAVDLDSDGDMDVLGAARDGDEITWWENDGSQNFIERIIAENYLGAYSLVVVDLDIDGDLDIVSAAYDGDEITWWENDGNQNFAERLISGIIDGPSELFAIDLDSDGDIDVLGAVYVGGFITWWENDGNQNFVEHLIDFTFFGAHHVHAADLDGDGDQDVIGAARINNEITWWENDGNGNFGQPIVIAAFENAVEAYAYDLDNDGDLDILGAGHAVGVSGIAWWENDGAQNFTEHTIDQNFNDPFHVAAVDFDNDGDLDVLAASNADDEIAWWQNDGDQTFSKQVIDGAFNGANYVCAADMDDDGDLDAVGAARYGDEIAWWENDIASFTEHTLYENFWDFCAADVNGDGHADIIGADSIGNEIILLRNDGNENFNSSQIEGGFLGANTVDVADIDGDGNLDILGAASREGDVAWWRGFGNGTFGGMNLIDAVFHWAGDVKAVDLDIDGDIDILGVSSAAGIGLHWWENDGNQNFTEHTIDSDQLGKNLIVADLEDDADLDILISWADNIYLCENDGAGNFLCYPFFGAPDVERIYAIDLDNDGDTDVLDAERNGCITWWENQGNMVFDRHHCGIGIDFLGAYGVHAGDIDNDGDIDVLGSSASPDFGKVAWFENDGDQNFIMHTIDGDFDNGRDVYAIDVDNDGDLDVLGSATAGNQMTWWENDLNPPWCDVNMIPDDDPVVVPPGGNFGLTGIIGNPTEDPIITDVWVGVKNPFGSLIVLYEFSNIPLNPGQYLESHLNQSVPVSAPPGIYQFEAYCGDLSSWTTCDFAYFSFTITGARLADGATEWILDGGWFENETAPDIPADYTLNEAYPNPFNATTTISYNLPIAGNVKLQVYNLLGQRVAVLVDGNLDSGEHTVTWDASDYSSGVYFYKLIVGDKMFTKRMTLLK